MARAKRLAGADSTRATSALLTVVLAAVVVASPTSAYFNPHGMDYQSPEVTPWPKPHFFTNGTGSVALTAAFDLSFQFNSSLDVLSRACQRYHDLITKQSARSPLKPKSPALARAGAAAATPPLAAYVVSISVESSDQTLGVKTNESYSLSVDQSGASIAAHSVYGALHGLESLSQLFEANTDGGFLLRGLPWHIQDSPRFSHRGVLLDSARHYLSLDSIRRNIDAMSYSKLNVMHWHLLDFQSFPYTPEDPFIANMSLGAFSAEERYSAADLRALVSYARDRGVRIMVEVDTPGHAASWGVARPEVMVHCPETIKAHGLGFQIFDPTVETTYTVLGAVLKELAGIFPDSTFHLGGDEVRKDCWNESAAIRSYMQAHGYGQNFSKLEGYYIERVLKLANQIMPDRTLVMYQEIFDNSVQLPGPVIFDVWKTNSASGLDIPHEIAAIVKQGHPVILANGNDRNWYLNDGFGNGNTVALWPDVYTLDPLNGTNALLSKEQQQLIVGGEASLWGEEINDNNLDEKAWPRAAAFGERMWSTRDLNPAAVLPLVGPRLARFYCKLTARGIRASPISPGSCLKQI